MRKLETGFYTGIGGFCVLYSYLDDVVVGDVVDEILLWVDVTDIDIVLHHQHYTIYSEPFNII